MSQHTPLHAAHLAAGARMVDFAGWDMPVNYGSQIEEHHAVRSDAGMFDVSHMLALDLTGEGATAYLRTLLANDVAKLGTLGKALYSCMLNDAGGVIDDLIVYYFAANHFRIVVNAGTADKDVAWMRKQIAALGANVTLDARRDLAMIAVQGPNARAKTWHAIPGSEAASVGLKPFFGAELGDMLIARTGYTGEDGFEITLPAANATDTWNALIAAGNSGDRALADDAIRLLDDPDAPGAEARAGTEPSAEEVVASQTVGGPVAEALATLGPDARAVVELVDVAGLTYAEAADVLDVPVGTVMSRLHRARRRIRDHLVARGITGPEGIR